MEESTVTVTNATKSWEAHGIQLEISEDSLPEGVDQCSLTIKVSLTGDYEFPENSHLVSAVYWIRCEPRIKFCKPMSVKMRHCAPRKNAHLLSFVKGHCTQKQLPYIFKPIGGYFNEGDPFGQIKLETFSMLGIVQETSVEREYYASVYYLEQDGDHAVHVHFVITWDTPAHIRVCGMRVTYDCIYVLHKCKALVSLYNYVF